MPSVAGILFDDIDIDQSFQRFSMSDSLLVLSVCKYLQSSNALDLCIAKIRTFWYNIYKRSAAMCGKEKYHDI